MSTEELKALFSDPLMLFFLMLFGALLSAAKQLIVARKQGASLSVGAYFLKVETVVMIGGVFFGWLGLLFSDTLNIVTATGLGYIANDVADIATKQGRSSAITPPEAAKP